VKNKNRRRKKVLPLIKRRTPPGASPGSVVIDPQAPKPHLRILCYSPSEFEEIESATLDQVRASLDRFPITWLNVEGLGDANVIERLGEIFQLHRLALEDVVNVHQRAKLEEYENWLYFVAPMACGGERFATEQVSLFVNQKVVLTFQEGRPGDPFDAVRERLRTGSGRLRSAGSDYLAYAIIDALLDGYFPVLERYGDRLDALEDQMLAMDSRRSAMLVDELHDVRHDLRLVRRAIWPQREAIAAMLRESTPFITDATRVYLRDCYDHVVQLIDLLETFREFSADLRDLHMSTLSNRINETMRILTIISTIFIPLTFIAGIYGMNFNPDVSPWNMPELRWYLGYPFSLAIMGITSLIMLGVFVRKGWIRFGRSEGSTSRGA